MSLHRSSCEASRVEDMKTYMVKVHSSDDDSTAWFFVAANDEAQVRDYLEDCTSTIVEIVVGDADIAQALKHEFDHVALVVDL